MNDAQRLLATIESQTLKARYFRMMGTEDWAGLEATFAPDLVADFRAAMGGKDDGLLIRGAASYVAQLAPILADVMTVHHAICPRFRINTPTIATGIWAMENKLWPGPGSALPYRFAHGYGHYRERYVRLADGWRIAEIRLSRLRIDAH